MTASEQLELAYLLGAANRINMLKKADAFDFPKSERALLDIEKAIGRRLEHPAAAMEELQSEADAKMRKLWSRLQAATDRGTSRMQSGLEDLTDQADRGVSRLLGR